MPGIKSNYSLTLIGEEGFSATGSWLFAVPGLNTHNPNPSHARSPLGGLAPPLKPLLNCLFGVPIGLEMFVLCKVQVDAWAYCPIRLNPVALLRGTVALLAPRITANPLLSGLIPPLCGCAHRADFDLGAAYHVISASLTIKHCTHIQTKFHRFIQPLRPSFGSTYLAFRHNYQSKLLFRLSSLSSCPRKE
jgi:hypothetical protein